MKIAVYVLLAVLLAGFLAALRLAAQSFWGERDDYVRHRSALSSHPEKTGIDGLAEVSFRDRDGVKIAGWYAPSKNRGAVVLVHGTGSDRSAVLFETAALAKAGFGVLAIDAPGQGGSEGRTRWGVPERAAILGAVDWLSARADVDPRRIGGLGVSYGAYVMTQAAAMDPRIRSVVLVAPPTDIVRQNWLSTAQWGLLTQLPCYLALRLYGQSLDMMPKDVIASIAPRPVFLLGGELDDAVPPAMVRELFDDAREPKQLWMVAGGHHADFARTAGVEYRDQIGRFLERTLLD